MPARFGLSCALATPFDDGGGIDTARLSRHVRWALGQGCTSATLFGTTGEGASLGDREKAATLEALAADGLAATSLIGCVAAPSVEGAVAQAKTFLDAGCRAILLTPPFYFKGVSDDALAEWFSAVFERLGGAARDVILYHLPSVTAVALSVDLIGRLRDRFPEVVMGVKDSSGEWGYTERLLAAHRDLTILVGDERSLAAACRAGAEGAISGMANIIPDVLLGLTEGRDDGRVSDLVNVVLSMPVIPAVKALTAIRAGDPAWERTRAPLGALDAQQSARLRVAYDTAFAAAAA